MSLVKKVTLGVLAVTAVSTLNISQVFAADNIFGGVNTGNSPLKTPPKAMPVESFQAPVGLPSTDSLNVNNTNNLNYKQEDQKLQEALINLDSAQSSLRSELNKAQAQYNEIDKNYKVIKLERKCAKKQVRDLNKKIRSIESTKKNIKKNITKAL